jgi:hypothetical protein
MVNVWVSSKIVNTLHCVNVCQWSSHFQVTRECAVVSRYSMCFQHPKAHVSREEIAELEEEFIGDDYKWGLFRHCRYCTSHQRTQVIEFDWFMNEFNASVYILHMLHCVCVCV